MELEDLPFTTPSYIFNLKKWTPRLYSGSKAGSEVKDISPWTDYSFEPLDNLKSSSRTSKYCCVLVPTNTVNVRYEAGF